MIARTVSIANVSFIVTYWRLKVNLCYKLNFYYEANSDVYPNFYRGNFYREFKQS